MVREKFIVENVCITILNSSRYQGGHTCITYDAINAAYIDARKRIRKFIKRMSKVLFNSKILSDVSTPKGDWKTEDIATVGELVLDISIQLARM